MFHYNWFHVKFYSNFTDTENATTEVTEKDVESFENLFAKLVNFKETAAGLPDEERKKFAEQVALSFYSALGEESDEDWFYLTELLLQDLVVHLSRFSAKLSFS